MVEEIGVPQLHGKALTKQDSVTIFFIDLEMDSNPGHGRLTLPKFSVWNRSEF